MKPGKVMLAVLTLNAGWISSLFNHASWVQEPTTKSPRQLIQWNLASLFTEFILIGCWCILSQEIYSQVRISILIHSWSSKQGISEDVHLYSRSIHIETGKFSQVFPPSMLETISPPQNCLVSRISQQTHNHCDEFFHQSGFHTCSNLLPYTGSWYTTL